ncbi:hypothetical protein GCM10023192_50120 [Amycolatopsis samaneae]
MLLGTFVLAGFFVASAFEAADTAAADTGCDPVAAVTAPTACRLASVTVQETGPVPRIVSSPIAVPMTRPVANSVTALVNATVGQTAEVVVSAAPTLAPAINQVGSAVRTATTATTVLTQTVDTVVRDTVATTSRTLDNPITNALAGTVSAITPVVSSAGPQPRIAVPGVVTITATSMVSTDSKVLSAPRPQFVPDALGDVTSAAPRATPAVDLAATTTPAAPLDGDCAFCASGWHGRDSLQRSAVTAAPAGLGSQRPADRLPLDFPAAPLGAVGSGNGTSSAGSGGGDGQRAIVLSERTARDERLACWGAGPDDVAPLRMRAQQPPVSPD